MCGIAGASFKDSALEKIAALGSIESVVSLLALDIEPRGHDATGIAWYDETTADQSIWYLKRPHRAKKFVRRAMKQIKNPIGSTFIVHTRQATQGKPEDNKNNHPFICGDIVGIHNGVVWNDDWLTKKHDLPRRAETDSEVIFQMLSKYGLENMMPLEDIEASMAIAYMENFNPDRPLYLAKGASSISPLHFATSDDGIVFSSFLESVENIVNLLELSNPSLFTASEGYWAKVVNGEIVSENKFEPTEGNWFYYNSTQSYQYQAPKEGPELKPNEKGIDWSKHFPWETETEFVERSRWWNHPHTCTCQMCIDYEMKKDGFMDWDESSEHPSVNAKLLEFPNKSAASHPEGAAKHPAGAAMQRAIEDSAECLDCGVEKVYCYCGGGEG